MSWLYQAKFSNRVAIAAGEQYNLTYGQLWWQASKIASQLPQPERFQWGDRQLRRPVPIICDPTPQFVVHLLAGWLAKHIMVPVNPHIASDELAYMLGDLRSSVSLCQSSIFKQHQEVFSKNDCTALQFERDLMTTDQSLPGFKLLNLDNLRSQSSEIQRSDGSEEDETLIIYTSGTTARPKGVVHTKKSLLSQIRGMSSEWEWTEKDRILSVLPLYHVHGLVNVVLTAIYHGACIEFLTWKDAQYGDKSQSKLKYGFNAEAFWQRIQQGGPSLTLFMAVPTIYTKLIESFKTKSVDEQTRLRRALTLRDSSPQSIHNFRLFVSGSSALPSSVFKQWERDVCRAESDEDIQRFRLLERYGMTETGMALTNPYRVGDKRIEGSVGYPFPGVEAKLSPGTDDQGFTYDRPNNNYYQQRGNVGELLIRGDNLFIEYWLKPNETAECFDGDWFKTGDIALRDCTLAKAGEVDGQGQSKNIRYNILGRNSVDIIKHKGYKVSALEIERALLEIEGVQEACVVGLDDQSESGERIVAVVVVKNELLKDSTKLTNSLQHKLNRYKLPQQYIFKDALPRNAMGKVNKKNIKQMISV
ncbi:hypothetical protein MP228_008895 [Amoeboaphelidium protococcarum]|nr:hypothetical protein MP228_008895 [Amoeboaphelidium protococcarum]